MHRSLALLLLAAAAVVVLADDEPAAASDPISPILLPPIDPSRGAHSDASGQAGAAAVVTAGEATSPAVASGEQQQNAQATTSLIGFIAATTSTTKNSIAAAVSSCAQDTVTSCGNSTISAEACLHNLRMDWPKLQEACRSAMLKQLPCMEDAANHCPSAVTGAQLGSCLMAVEPEGLNARCVSWLQSRRQNWQASWVEQLPIVASADDEDDASLAEGSGQQWTLVTSSSDFLFTIATVAVVAASIGACCTMCCSRRASPASFHHCCCRNGGCARGGAASAAAASMHMGYLAAESGQHSAAFDPRGIAYCRPLPLEHMPASNSGYAVLTEEVTRASAV